MIRNVLFAAAAVMLSFTTLAGAVGSLAFNAGVPIA